MSKEGLRSTSVVGPETEICLPVLGYLEGEISYMKGSAEKKRMKVKKQDILLVVNGMRASCYFGITIHIPPSNSKRRNVGRVFTLTTSSVCTLLYPYVGAQSLLLLLSLLLLGYQCPSLLLVYFHYGILISYWLAATAVEDKWEGVNFRLS